jgi:hypothetical protein
MKIRIAIAVNEHGWDVIGWSRGNWSQEQTDQDMIAALLNDCNIEADRFLVVDAEIPDGTVKPD